LTRESRREIGAGDAQFVDGDTLHRSDDAGLFLSSVAYHHDVVDLMGPLSHGYVYFGPAPHDFGLLLESEERELKLGICVRYAYLIFAVCVGDRSVGRSLDHDCHTGESLAFGISYRTGDGNVRGLRCPGRCGFSGKYNARIADCKGNVRSFECLFEQGVDGCIRRIHGYFFAGIYFLVLIEKRVVAVLFNFVEKFLQSDICLVNAERRCGGVSRRYLGVWYKYQIYN